MNANRADTNRDGKLTEADDPGNLWSISRGALISPTMTPWDNNPLPYTKLTAPVSVDTRGWTSGTTFRLAVEPSANAPSGKLCDWLVLFDASGKQLFWDTNARIKIDAGVLTNLHAASWAARKCATTNFPDAFNLRLEITPPGATVPLPWDSVRLKVAPLILPPECNPATAIYSVRDISDSSGKIVIPKIAGNTAPTVWTQDMVKFPKAQFCATNNVDVALGLGHGRDGNLMDILAKTNNLLRTDWSVGICPIGGTNVAVNGNGGNIMATMPLPDAPYGKILMGTARRETKPYWERQSIQPIIEIPNDWLLVGHVDELFMPVASNTILYADPWTAADFLHGAISIGATNTTLWCGWMTNKSDKVKTVIQVAVDSNRLTRLLAPMNTSTTTIVCGQTLFRSNDFLRVNDEILRVTATNANGYVVERAKGNRPAASHASNDVVYALSKLMEKNLMDGWGNVSTNKSVVTLIAAAREPLRQGLGGGNSWFIPVPVLFDNGHPNYINYPNEFVKFAAVTANLVNCQPVNNWGISVFYSDPGNDMFKTYFEGVVPKPNVSIAVDAWDTYHCNLGEIHCGTATTRSLSHTPSWWDQVSSTNAWKNEQ